VALFKCEVSWPQAEEIRELELAAHVIDHHRGFEAGDLRIDTHPLTDHFADPFKGLSPSEFDAVSLHPPNQQIVLGALLFTWLAGRTQDNCVLVDQWECVMTDGLQVFELRWELPLVAVLALLRRRHGYYWRVTVLGRNDDHRAGVRTHCGIWIWGLDGTLRSPD
jgi:hypothetical protein